MILHVFNDQKKFSYDYFRMLKDYEFDLSEHKLVHYGKASDMYELLGVDTLFIPSFFSIRGCFTFYKLMCEADKIIVHSMASPLLIYIVGVDKKIADKIFWVIWGKDLYLYHLSKEKSVFLRLYEHYRKKAFARVKHVIPILYRDYELANKWYNTNAEVFENNMLYPYCIDRDECYSVSSYKEQIDPKKWVVLLGNSASETNRHIDALNKLKRCEDSISKIYCPLSYNGKRSYIDAVIVEGKKLFGDRFVPMQNFVPREKYFEILREVSIGFFNYERQEGLGNIYSLILQGKTVYLNKNTSSYSFFSDNGIKVKEIQNVNSELSVFSSEELRENVSRLSPLISVEKSVEKWKNVFN